MPPFRLTLALTALAAPAFAEDVAWAVAAVDQDPGIRLTALLTGCTAAMADPTTATVALAAANWTRSDEFDGTIGFQTDATDMMFWTDPGFCLVSVTDFNTETLTAQMAKLDITPSGQDAAGCAQFTVEGTTATLTGGGNDPACTSTTEAVLRFEPAQ